MNNTEKVLHYGECFGKHFCFTDKTPVTPDWRTYEHSYHLLRCLFIQSDRGDPPHQVGLRIYYLDVLYSTQLYRISRSLTSGDDEKEKELYSSLARLLSQLDKDKHLYEKIEKGDAKAVNIIVEEIKKLTERNLFSFASKYCFFHNEVCYPIYDSLAMGSLRFYADRDQKTETSKKHAWKEGLKKLEPFDYAVFKDVINQFKEAFELEISYKELDKYLWTFGRALGVGKKKKEMEIRAKRIPDDAILSLSE